MVEQNIFVSYSRSDADFVVKLSTELKKYGAKVWLDQLDIPFGAIWDVEIERALEACTCLLFIVSKSSVASANVLNEVYYALEDSKRVLPVKINDCKIPFRIRRLQYIDLTTNYDKGFLQLLKTLSLEAKPESTLEKEPDDEEQIWGAAKSGNTKYSIEEYLTRFPDGKFKKEALGIIDKMTRNEIEVEILKAEQILWANAVSKNTIASYQNYLSATELAAHVDEANGIIVELKKKIEEDSEDNLWQRAEKENTINEYGNYLILHPTGNYADTAKTKIRSLENSNEEALWNVAKNTNTVSSFQHYIKNTKAKKYEREANLSIEQLQKIEQEQSFWLKVKKENTVSGFREYLKTCKNGIHIDDALLAIKTFEQEESKIPSVSQPSNARKIFNKAIIPFFAILTIALISYLIFHKSGNGDASSNNGTKGKIDSASRENLISQQADKVNENVGSLSDVQKSDTIVQRTSGVSDYGITTKGDLDGTHNLTLQWISWEIPGKITFNTIGNNKYEVDGYQKAVKSNNVSDNDYLKVNGTIEKVTPKKLRFTGKIESSVYHIKNGQPCIKEGTFDFVSTGNRKYWRCQNMDGCDGVTDYVDIYFK